MGYRAEERNCQLSTNICLVPLPLSLGAFLSAPEPSLRTSSCLVTPKKGHIILLLRRGGTLQKWR